MALSAAYRAFVEELFETVFPIRIRPMFGGAGIYSGDVMFGLIVDERVYLKTNETNQADFAAENAGPFVYATKSGEQTSMSYYELPERLYDEPEELRAWAMKALDVALRARNEKPKKSKRPGAGKPRALTNKPRKTKP